MSLRSGLSGTPQAIVREQNLIAPFAVLFIMFSALSMAGQGLLTSTLEKTTRVSEVLLGAFSHGAVDRKSTRSAGGQPRSHSSGAVRYLPPLVVRGVRGGPLAAVYLLLFIAIASLSWAAVMGGISGAMNDLTEARASGLFMIMMLLFGLLLAIGKPSPSSS